jgi:hypothetical protein
MGDKAARLYYTSLIQFAVAYILGFVFVVIIVVGVITQSLGTRHLAWGIGAVGIVIGWVGVWNARRAKLAMAKVLDRPYREVRRAPLLNPSSFERWLANQPSHREGI